MSLTIWKFPLTVTLPAQYHLPEGYQILSVGMQGQEINMWVQLDSAAPRKLVTVQLVPTGGVVPEHGVYLDTVLVDNGQWVLHAYELREPRV